jgi:rhodanese-related sulfurtransferase
MIGFLKKLFSSAPATDYAALIKDGAAIVDVRSKGEFAGGHIKGSINIPLDVLKTQMGKLNKEKPVIVCCASGMRSASAKGILQSNGFTQVYNGGGWSSLQNKIN